MEERPAGEPETPVTTPAAESGPAAAPLEPTGPTEAPPLQEGATSIEGGEGVGRLPLPRKERGEIYGIANQLLGAARIRVMCEDNVSRMGRITGKLKKKMWIREGDLLILRPWGFQEGKADILFRYSRTQANYLSRRHLLPASIDLFGGEVPPEPPRRRH